MAKNLPAKRDPRDIALGGMTLTAVGIEFDADLTFEQWDGAGMFIERADGGIQWWLGDWSLAGEKWGDKYQQSMSKFDARYGTVNRCRWVCSRFQLIRRRINLSFAHHTAVAALEPCEQDELLDLAVPEAPDKPPRLSVAELSKMARERRPATPKELLQWCEQLKGSVRRVIDECPEDYRRPLAGQLASMAEEIIENGELA